jgi:hypothetical protein
VRWATFSATFSQTHPVTLKWDWFHFDRVATLFRRFFVFLLTVRRQSVKWLSLLGEYQGCQIFLEKTYQNGERYTKLLLNIGTKMAKNIPNGRKICRPNGHKMYKHPLLQYPPKFTQSGYFGLKNLATLESTSPVKS